MCTLPQSVSNHLVCTHVSLIVSEVNIRTRDEEEEEDFREDGC